MLVQIDPPTTINTGRTTVTSAGTRVSLIILPVLIKAITIKALSSNTGLIYIGNSLVSSSNGFQLSAGDSVSFDINNSNLLYLDSSISGDGCTYIYIN